MTRKSLNVAIIGAGASGLSALRCLLEPFNDTDIKPVVFEKRDCIGGTWAYQESGRETEIYSVVYRNLRTNQPKESIFFPEFPYSKDQPSFLHHTAVLQYIKEFAEHFNLMDYIKLNTKVVRVIPEINKENDRFVKWRVWITELSTKVTEEMIFDAVVICSGQFTEPNRPVIKNIELFKGEMLHSAFFDDPKIYRNKKILILGASYSGMDIATMLALERCTVLLSHYKERIMCPLHENIIEKENINYVDTDGKFVFDDGSKEAVDIFIACTGYKFSFPFLTPECELSVEKNILRPLYKHMFHAKYPSMSFVGIPTNIPTFPLFYLQSICIRSILSGYKQLPSEKKMCEEIQAEIQRKADACVPFHKLFKSKYTSEICELSDCHNYPEYTTKLHEFNAELRAKTFIGYRCVNYEVTGSKDKSLKLITKDGKLSFVISSQEVSQFDLNQLTKYLNEIAINYKI